MPTKRTGGSSKAGQAGRTCLGKAIANDSRRRAETAPEARGERACGVSEGQAKRSVLEQSSLDEFLAQAALSSATFEAERGVRFVEEGPRLVSVVGRDSEALVEAARRIVVPIPWRPVWQEASSPEELARSEGEAFLEWRRSLARVEEQHHVVMTPYERNIDFWRQLWRCVERSDLLVQIVDARDPDFFRSRDLERYVQTRFPSKRLLLVMNKSDFLKAGLRRRWAAYWSSQGVDVVFFSALRELHRQRSALALAHAGGHPASDGSVGVDADASFGSGALRGGSDRDVPDAADSELPRRPHGDFDDGDTADVLDTSQLLEELRGRLPGIATTDAVGKHRGVVGFVGYPNVGKSSVINALFGTKKVSMSRTPGKTKHLQTLELPGADLTLCDCPGLVFPSVVATKAHLAINGTVPLVELKDAVGPVRVIVEKMGLERLLERYGLTEECLGEAAQRLGDADVAASRDPARLVLAGVALFFKRFLRAGVPDETWAARRLLRDFCTGALLHCEEPREGPRDPGAQGPGVEEATSEESDFSDLDAFLSKAGDERGSRP